MIELQPGSEMLKRQPTILFFPESPAETAMIRGVLTGYVAREQGAGTRSGRGSGLVARMILGSLAEIGERDPKQGGAKLCLSFPNNQSLVLQRAFAAVGTQSDIAAKIAGFDLGGVSGGYLMHATD